jgi:thiol-disulfide isomerase/thioredoxin
MRTLQLTVVLTGALLTTVLSAEEKSETGSSALRTWTSKKGDTIQAAFEKTAYGNVYLKKEDGSVISIKKIALTAEDQAVVDQLAPPAAGSALTTAKKEAAPKAPQELYDLFGDKLRTAKNKPVSVDELTDKVIGIYFSAHWCPPCRAFTPQLVKFYDKLKAENKPFEIVFVSSDRSKDAMYEYMEEAEMKWLALPFGDKHKDSLAQKFRVSGIPKFVVLNSKGELISENGRGEVSGDNTKAFDAWAKKN